MQIFDLSKYQQFAIDKKYLLMYFCNFIDKNA